MANAHGEDERGARVVIIGAGLSGRLLAMNLLRAPPAPGDVQLLDRRDERDVGPAYSGDEDCLLLNVPAARMGAFSEDQEHFLRWARRREIAAEPGDFLPRTLYRDYLLEVLAEAVEGRAAARSFAQGRSDVTDIAVEGGGATIHRRGQAPLAADRVVLALGNFPPRHPPVSDPSVLASNRYARNPWEPGVLDAIGPEDPLVLVGTGQTTVDLAVALDRRGHRGRVMAISRRGILPLAHRGFAAYAPFVSELEGCRGILDLVKIVRQHVVRAHSIGLDERAVIDSLRPITQSLWSRLPPDEKRRFVRHVFRYWEIVRSRIPPASDALVARMRAAGTLEVVAGRVLDLVETGTAVEVHYAPRGRATRVVEAAALVINCMGPESDWRRVDDPLVENLLARGLIRPGPADLGVDALPDGTIIGRDGATSDVLFTLGSTMKGVLWEVLAVPEIRLQAEHLARRLLEPRREGSPERSTLAGRAGVTR
jgi:uncharacterized NAD(P)/FAD-binding protein YdhS